MKKLKILAFGIVLALISTNLPVNAENYDDLAGTHQVQEYFNARMNFWNKIGKMSCVNEIRNFLVQDETLKYCNEHQISCEIQNPDDVELLFDFCKSFVSDRNVKEVAIQHTLQNAPKRISEKKLNEINKVLYSYLKQNLLESLDIEDAEKYDIFFSGETHATQKNFDVQLDIIKNLSTKTNLKYILAEDSFANSYYINNYLKTGDTANLDVVFEDLNGTSMNNNEYYEHLTKLYKFNSSLPTDKKVTYIGIDVEHQHKTAIKLLKKLIENIEFYKNSKELKDTLNSSSAQDLYKTAYALQGDFFERGDGLEAKIIFEENFWNFKYLIQNIINTSESLHLWRERKYHEFSTTRENAIIENFKKVYEHFPNGKFYGQWGLEHAYLSPIKTIPIYKESDDRLASYLNINEESPVKGKVCSMAIIYFDSFEMNNKSGASEKIEYPTLSNEKKETTTLKFFAKDGITFFKLDGKKSPFKNSLYYLQPQSISRVTTDYFQYVIVIKNSPACTMRLV